MKQSRQRLSLLIRGIKMGNTINQSKVYEVRSNGGRFYHVRAGSSEGAILIVNGFHLRADWFANEIVPNHVSYLSVLGNG